MGRVASWLLRPWVAILLVAPLLGEALSTSTAPLDLLLPWNLALSAALYGCGALLCRELRRRGHLGLVGMCLLAAAYAVYEEALVDGYWFDAAYQHKVGLDGYSRVWDVNVLLAVHLTVFHVVVSVYCSVFLVERLFPAYRDRAWVSGRGLVLAGLALVGLVPFLYGEAWRGPAAQQVAAAGLLVALVAAAYAVPRIRPTHVNARATTEPSRRPRPRLVGWVVFLCTATHFLLVYAMPSIGPPWPVGLILAMSPVVLAAAVAHRWLASDASGGRDGLPVVTGVLAFFLLLDSLVGLGGRYDLTLVGLVGAFLLWRLGRRDLATGPAQPGPRSSGQPDGQT